MITISRTDNKRELQKKYVFTTRFANVLKALNINSLYDVEKAFQFLIDKKIKHQQAEEYFKNALDNLNITESNKKIWFENFKLLLKYLTIKVQQEKNEELNPTRKTEKIIVSGMGFSGSGAVQDYFKEYNNIQSLGHEFSIIDRKYSFSGIEKHYNKKSLKGVIINFFKYTLFSNCIPTNLTEVNAMSKNIFFQTDKDGKYAEAVNIFLKQLFNLLIENFDSEKYRRITSDFFDALMNILNDDNKKYVLLNNIIKINKIEAVEYISDYKIFCTFRDPRSNFVDRCICDKRFHGNASKYIKRYKYIHKNYNKYLKNNPDKKIYTVQFEDFVTSESYRKTIAEKAGLDLKDHGEFKILKPWESEKNIYNYKDFKDQKAIRKIEKKLSEYLWDKKI